MALPEKFHKHIQRSKESGVHIIYFKLENGEHFGFRAPSKEALIDMFDLDSFDPTEFGLDHKPNPEDLKIVAIKSSKFEMAE